MEVQVNLVANAGCQPDAKARVRRVRVRVRWTVHWPKVGVRVRAVPLGLQCNDQTKDFI
jgi:hypothetical protein